MIDRFYVKHLEGEMNIEAIQSKRRRKLPTKQAAESAQKDSADMTSTEKDGQAADSKMPAANGH
jgi:hypothetical protein